MALKDIFKISRKTFVDPRSWLGYDLLKANTQGVWDTAKGVFVKPVPGKPETFEQATKRLKLNSEEINALANTYFFFALGFLITSGILIIVSFFLLFSGFFLAMILGIGVTILSLSQSFRYHFWYFQIKHKKLGCTFQEWKQATLKDMGFKS